MLSEFTVLRAEINRRSDAQGKIVGLHLTALAAIVGLLVENKVDQRYAMVLTLLSTALGLLLWWISLATLCMLLVAWAYGKHQSRRQPA